MDPVSQWPPVSPTHKTYTFNKILITRCRVNKIDLVIIYKTKVISHENQIARVEMLPQDPWHLLQRPNH